jgi:V8-like Glu-specific endopeptidase
LIRDENPMGTGEGDYAFLYITENINKNIEKPKEFTYAKFDLNHDYKKGDKVFTAGYPGSPTSTKNLSASSKLISEETKIYDVFTLNSNSIDIFSTEINKVAQKGSSGGGVFKSDRLIGLIVTITKNNAGNKINALTTEYINRNLISKEGFSVESLLKGDYITASLDIKVKEFYDTNFENLRSLLLKVY